MTPRYEKIDKVLKEVLTRIEDKWISLEDVTIYEGYIDFNFIFPSDSNDIYIDLLSETMLSCDRDTSQNEYKVRVFY